MIRRKIIQLRTFQIQNADDAVLEEKRNRKLRTRLRIDGDVARIEGHVWHNDGAAQSGRRADDAFVRRYNRALHDVLPEFHVKAMAKNTFRLVVKQDAENLVVDDALDHFGRAAQDAFDVKNGIGFARDFIEEKERIRLMPRALVKPGIFNRAG